MAGNALLGADVAASPVGDGMRAGAEEPTSGRSDRRHPPAIGLPVIAALLDDARLADHLDARRRRSRRLGEPMPYPAANLR